MLTPKGVHPATVRDWPTVRCGGPESGFINCYYVLGNVFGSAGLSAVSADGYSLGPVQAGGTPGSAGSAEDRQPREDRLWTRKKKERNLEKRSGSRTGARISGEVGVRAGDLLTCEAGCHGHHENRKIGMSGREIWVVRDGLCAVSAHGHLLVTSNISMIN